jgi:hypothetical protein
MSAFDVAQEAFEAFGKWCAEVEEIWGDTDLSVVVLADLYGAGLSPAGAASVLTSGLPGAST